MTTSGFNVCTVELSLRPFAEYLYSRSFIKFVVDKFILVTFVPIVLTSKLLVSQDHSNKSSKYKGDHHPNFVRPNLEVDYSSLIITQFAEASLNDMKM